MHPLSLVHSLFQFLLVLHTVRSIDSVLTQFIQCLRRRLLWLPIVLLMIHNGSFQQQYGWPQISNVDTFELWTFLASFSAWWPQNMS